MQFTPGTRFGPYEITGPLGAGGMGEVYKARDTRLSRDVAVKVLPSALAHDAEFQERFHREARTLSQIEHPHICAVYDVGADHGTAYLVMPLLDGETLAARLARGPLPADDALRIALEICGALDTAHRHGIVHRDLKPGNVMLTRSGARLLDFGLAKPGPAAASARDTTTVGVDPVTARGAVLGTLNYMAPEQLRGLGTDARSDIFAFGVLLYEMLAGKRPFEASDTASLIASILEHAVPPLGSLMTVSPRLDRTIQTAMAKDPDDRWQTVRDLARELRWIKEESGVMQAPGGVGAVSRRPGRRVWIGAAALTALALVIGLPPALRRDETFPVNARPVAVLMDSAHPLRVYDDATRRVGGTNADDLTDVLGGLGATLLKETTGPSWHREDQILAQNPDVVVVHRSCFYDATLLDDLPLNQKYFDQLYPAAADKLETFLGYVALGNPRTKFVVYSRGSWVSETAKAAWIGTVERRFPRLTGRLFAYRVPDGRQTFKHPETGSEIKALVTEVLAASVSGTKTGTRE